MSQMSFRPRTLIVAALLALLSAALPAAGREGANASPVPAIARLAAAAARPAPSPAKQVAAPSPQPAVAPSCDDPQPPFVTDLEVRQTPPLAEPPARTPFRDPVFGGCVVRVTDRTGDLAQGDPAHGLKNEYSRVQSFNADGSRMVVRTIEADWYLYDARTLQPLGRMDVDGAEPRWDADDPDTLYFSAETRLMSYNVQTRQQRLVHDFAADFPGQQLSAVWTRWEGSPSLDGRYWGLMAEDLDWTAVALLVYDRQSDRVIAKRDLRGVSGPSGEPLDPDNVTISPLGNYLVADFSDSFCERGTLGDDARPCGLMVYDRELTAGRGLLRLVGHGDLALDADGREVLLFQDPSTDDIAMVDLATGTVTSLWPIDFSHTALGMHLSGRAFRRPGWAVVSTYNGGHPTDLTWMDDQVFLVELKQDGRVVRLAHTRSLYDEGVEQDYWAEPHASANPDLTRILFTSNWGRSGTEEVEMFMLQLPPDWPDHLP